MWRTTDFSAKLFIMLRFRPWMMLLAAGLSSLACKSQPPSDGAAVAPPQAAAAAGRMKLGAPIGASPKISLANIAKDAPKYAKGTVTTEGKVTAVCQAMGCWMEIADTASEAHVRMSGHSFFIPKTASGRRAVVQGKVLAKPDNGECEQEAAEATGKVVKVELDATGVELL
jgi:hypothetical protein